MLEFLMTVVGNIQSNLYRVGKNLVFLKFSHIMLYILYKKMIIEWNTRMYYITRTNNQ